jgi:hypothetical protein
MSMLGAQVVMTFNQLPATLLASGEFNYEVHHG